MKRVLLLLAMLSLFVRAGYGQAGSGPQGAIPQTTYTTLPTGSSSGGTSAIATTFATAFGVKADVKEVTDATITNGSATVTCPNADCGFSASDVGKVIKGTNRSTDTSVLTVPTQTCFVAGTTISTFNSATSVTLSNTSSCPTVTAVGNFAWGTDDTTNLATAWTAAASVCGMLILPAGTKSFIKAGEFNTSPALCNGSGQLAARIGPTVSAIGTGPSTYLIPLTGFDATTCTGPNGSGAICIGAGAVSLSNFSIDGMGESALGATFNNKIGIAPSVLFGSNPQIVNMELSAWGTTTSGFTGEECFSTASSCQVINVQNDGFGFLNCNMGSNAPAQTMLINSFCAVGGGVNLIVNAGIVSSTNSIYGFSTGTGNVDNVEVQGGATFISSQDTYPYQTGASRSQLSCLANGATVGNIFLSQAILANPTASAFTIAQNPASGSCNVHIKQSTVSGTTPTDLLFVGAASKFFDEGGNVFTGGPSSVNATGLFITSPTSSYSSFSGLIPTCGTVTGATATCALGTGSTNEKGVMRITVTAAGTANGTVTMNFIGTYAVNGANNPTCTFTPAQTGTATWNARATTLLSTRSTTAPIINWDNNAVALTNSAFDIDYTCIAK